MTRIGYGLDLRLPADQHDADHTGAVAGAPALGGRGGTWSRLAAT